MKKYQPHGDSLKDLVKYRFIFVGILSGLLSVVFYVFFQFVAHIWPELARDPKHWGVLCAVMMSAPLASRWMDIFLGKRE